MSETSQITIPARRGKAALLSRGQSVRVINNPRAGRRHLGLPARRPAEFMSMEHSRTSLERIMPVVGQSMVTNRRRPILTLVDDTSGGIHDTLLAACDRYRYELLGSDGYHDNCTDNLEAALSGVGAAAAGDSQSLEPVHEHPGGDGRLGELPAPGVRSGRPRHAARRDGLHRCVLSVPAGRCPHQRLRVRAH